MEKYDTVKPTRVTDGFVKDFCGSNKLALPLVAETLIEPHPISGGTRVSHIPYASLSQIWVSLYVTSVKYLYYYTIIFTFIFIEGTVICVTT